jgi:hypothetical protein
MKQATIVGSGLVGSLWAIYLSFCLSSWIKNISSKDISKGTRAGRGNKIFPKDQIVNVELKEKAGQSKQLCL